MLDLALIIQGFELLLLTKMILFEKNKRVETLQFIHSNRKVKGPCFRWFVRRQDQAKYFLKSDIYFFFLFWGFLALDCAFETFIIVKDSENSEVYQRISEHSKGRALLWTTVSLTIFMGLNFFTLVFLAFRYHRFEFKRNWGYFLAFFLAFSF
mmetsp:Transcript_33368/g.51177  ORF Transcript_33368/g.51177 Transcript_33368/m.51177 type:complete len:153 (+) Transcript_33368:374-832(+)